MRKTLSVCIVGGLSLALVLGAYTWGRTIGHRDAIAKRSRFDVLVHLSALSRAQAGSTNEALDQIELLLSRDVYDLLDLCSRLSGPRRKEVEQTLERVRAWKIAQPAAFAPWPLIPLPPTNAPVAYRREIDEQNRARNQINAALQAFLAEPMPGELGHRKR